MISGTPGNCPDDTAYNVRVPSAERITERIDGATTARLTVTEESSRPELPNAHREGRRMDIQDRTKTCMVYMGLVIRAAVRWAYCIRNGGLLAWSMS